MAKAKARTKLAPLHRWKWQGKGPKDRLMKGELIGRSREEIVDQLAKQRITVLKIQKRSSFSGRGKVASVDIMLFARQMATMMRAGIPILQALQAISESMKKPAMVDLTQQIMRDVSSGDSLSQAMARHPKQFDRLFVNLVNAGEQAGALDQMLERIAIYKEKVASLKSRVKKALWYPAAVLTIGLAVTMILLVVVVPEFESMFQGFGAELPMLTQLTVQFSELAQVFWLPTLALIVGAILLLKAAARRSDKVAYKIDQFLLRLPVLGDILHKSAVSRFTRTLATTFSSGVPLIEGLETASGAADNRVYMKAINEVRQDVTTGQQLHFAMRLTNRFPALAVQMVNIGEEAGSLDAMLNRVADYYEEEVENKVDTLTSLMEPVIIVVLGLLVGGVVVSMYLPIFEIGTAL
ncbi:MULTISPECIES: type II secretion system F family protein [unclassified Halomonas]|uniref:type II secretion system F family protein n=1 Tax=unclassified Halomonas TaxID=2609666 RepID=UPI0021E48997|nr:MULTISPECIES: type II secretion system F family protein [unclassified Halomonas]UYG01597.1 type II secretion system F family protein [Halomonas sp. GD1P12]WNL40565.1 type II secretion system F family protein [Halomonas sp. PAMB 3232]WNL43894.1 type II secretion system F family protein [Halomonas sp. PAMB 3264]